MSGTCAVQPLCSCLLSNFTRDIAQAVSWFFFFIFIILFIYFWLCWVFTAVRALPSLGVRASHCDAPFIVECQLYSAWTLAVVAHGLSCPPACGIFPD